MRYLLALLLLGCYQGPTEMRPLSYEEELAVGTTHYAWAEAGLPERWCSSLRLVQVAELSREELQHWCYADGNEGILACTYSINRSLAESSTTAIFVLEDTEPEAHAALIRHEILHRLYACNLGHPDARHEDERVWGDVARNACDRWAAAVEVYHE